LSLVYWHNVCITAPGIVWCPVGGKEEMRSTLKLALVLGVSAPVALSSTLAMAQTAAAPPPAAAAPVPPPPPPPPAVVVVPTAPPGQAPTTVVAAVPVVDGKVEVHIQTKELVTLEHRSGPDGAWQFGCQTPCDTRLPAGDQYRVVGEGLNESEPFALTSPNGDVVKISVSPGLRKRERTGEILTLAGAAVFVGAVVVGLAAANPGSVFQANGSTDNYNWNVIAVGTGVAVAALTTGIVGASWWYDNSRTRVAGDVQGEPPARGANDPRFAPGLRLAGSVMPPAYTATVFTTSF
jgi:hypothetical protein